ncbi:MAG: sulfite exporter TauE/SafE family protein [Rhodospirillales bacterium]|nr:sulfite exporter TauE/SafE family protein [Rhodospirillales bacterium]MCB9980460.1 sulfite exporter TauE/SafE family protein [Rhodospirillales bacterium]
MDLIDSNLYFVLLFLIGLTTGIVGAMGGSGGLIVTPFMILTGVPPLMAIGCTKISSLGMWFITLLKFKNAQRIEWRYVPFLVILAISGGGLGASFAVQTKEGVLLLVVGILTLIACVIMLLIKNFGQKSVEKPFWLKNTGFVFYFFAMTFGGFFGGGSGTFIILTLVGCFGMKALNAHATDILPWMSLNIVSSAIFAWHGYYDIFYIIILFISTLLGGWIGAHLAIKGGDIWVKRMVCIFGIIAGSKFVYDGIYGF